MEPALPTERFEQRAPCSRQRRLIQIVDPVDAYAEPRGVQRHAIEAEHALDPRAVPRLAVSSIADDGVTRKGSVPPDLVRPASDAQAELDEGEAGVGGRFEHAIAG